MASNKKKISFEEWIKLEKANRSKIESTADDDIAPVKQVTSADTKRFAQQKENDERTWFQKGGFSALDDGFQLSDLKDISQTMVSSTVDLKSNIGGGLLEIGEKVVDAGAYLAGGVGKLFGADEFAEDTKNFIAKDLYDGEKIASYILSPGESIVLNAMGVEDYDEKSIYGEKTDSLLQSGGQLAGTIGLQAVGVPWFVTSGVTGFGGEVESSFADGAGYVEAGLSGAISAGSEIITEKLFGGSGLGEKGLINLDPLTKGISNKLAKALADWGIDMAAEGVEEVLSSAGSKLGQALYKEENLWELLTSEEAFDEYLESFIGGAALSGVMNVSKVNRARQKNGGRDYRTGLTTNEESVFNKVYESEIAKAEKDEKTLSKKEKAALYDDVMKKLERGEISLDTIEEVLGGDNYTQYQNLVKEADEFNTLYETESGKLSKKQQDRLAELEEKNKANSYKNQLKEMGDKLSSDVFNLAKGSKLEESYREAIRQTQKFDADLEQYSNPLAKKTVKNAIDRGLMYNGRDAHDFVDFAAKISEDKGYEVDFVTTEILQKMVEEGNPYNLEADPNKIEAFVSEKNKKILVNLDAKKSLNSLLGHEITDTLRKTKHYAALQKAAFSYAQTKGEYDTRLESVKRRYKDINADINGELTSDIVGDYLATDYEFIQNLAANHQNVFQQIWNEIKHLCKLATAGSKEARKLESMRHNFEKAWRETKGSKSTENGTIYSVGAIDNEQNLVYNGKRGEEYVRTDEFRNLQAESQRMPYADTQLYWSGAKKIDEGLRERLSRSVKQIFLESGNNGRSNDSRLLKFTAKGNQYNIYEKVDAYLFRDVFEIAQKHLRYGELVDLHDVETTEEHGIGYIECYNYLSEDGLSGFSITPDGDLISVFNASGKNGFLRAIAPFVKENAKTLDCYISSKQDLQSMYETIFGFKTASIMDNNPLFDHDDIRKNHDIPKVAFMVNTEADVETRAFTKDEYDEALAYRNSFVNQATDNKVASFMPKNSNEEDIAPAKYSLSETSLSDSDGRQLSVKQQEYFKDSKVRDENGNLKVMYHGTPNGNFSVFKDGTYFTENKWYADLYQNPGASSISTGKVASDPKTFEVYLDIKKPFDINDAEARSIYINDYIKGGNAIGINPYLSDAEYDKISSIDWTEGEDLREFLIDNGYDYDGLVLDEGAVGGYGEEVKQRGKSYVIFNSEQVKDVDNLNPTSDPDIRNFISEEGTPKEYGKWNIYGKDIRYKGAPTQEDIAPIQTESVEKPIKTDQKAAPTKEAYEAIKPKPEKEPRMARATPQEEARADILTEEPKVEKNKRSGWSMFREKVLDKGSVFEKLSLKTKNRELIGKWNYTLSSESRAQRFMQNGADGVKSLDTIRKEVESTGKTKEFYEYLYHKHNVDRMNLEERYEDTENKPVFGYSVTSEVSQGIVDQYETENPDFKAFADDVYSYMNHLRKQMVDSGVISQETADLWAEMYPHYVPIRRAGDSGLNIDVPLDTGRTGVNAPIKRAKGGNRDILPLFDTMAQRTIQTYKAIAKNNFGVELKNTLGSTIESDTVSVDDVIDSIDTQDELLQEGKNGKNPTFTVFENGEKVTFEITDEMYSAMKPKSDALSYRNKILNTMSSFHRGLLTQYNPVFMVTNAIKDVQDVLINSQHAAKTYATLPKAYKELATKGKWYTEYMDNGGEQNTYFDSSTNTFTEEKKGIRKLVGMPIDIISAANNFIEMAPRLAEYIASRESGASVEVAMLDAARVTTNFSAGGDLTKFLDGNGATFLNASIQGAMQQVRNVREAKANGLKGWVNLATKFAIAGLPAMILNGLLWDDDEEYEELADYVKENYYIVAKYGDGQFVRIPKGRALAVIQNAMEQVKNAATGEDEVDLKSFLDLAITNLAPNNPIDSNILAPIMQVANNETWYGEDLVPTRLQDLPAAEQFDESTDAFSKWLGETLNYSPYKINYLLNQYSGGAGDVLLPMLTPEAESGDNSLLGNMIAPLKDKFTTDSVMNNQNVSDFYDTKDKLTANAKSSKATDEDVLKNKFFNAINSELSDLYKRKREIQSGNLPDAEKYEAVREIQKEINALTKYSLEEYNGVTISGSYATVGNLRYRLTDKGEWTKVTDKQYEKQKEVTSFLDISGSEYWSNKTEYDFAYEYPERYAVSNAVGGFEAYKKYTSELYDIKADKDSSGKSISGSRKSKVIDYVNSLDIDYGEAIILFKSEYKADDTYNYDIIEYLNSRSDISYEEMETILKELGFTVYSDGRIAW